MQGQISAMKHAQTRWDAPQAMLKEHCICELRDSDPPAHRIDRERTFARDPEPIAESTMIESGQKRLNGIEVPLEQRLAFSALSAFAIARPRVNLERLTNAISKEAQWERGVHRKAEAGAFTERLPGRGREVGHLTRG
jgi:hypothetical protein